MLHGTLGFFLLDQGEDMRKWDDEPTVNLEARVRELRAKRAVKKGPPKKAVSLVAVETQEGNQQSARHRRTEITSLDPGEGTSGLAPKGSDSEYSDQGQKQRVPAFGQEEERDERGYWTVWIRWPVSWFNPRPQLSPTQLLAHSPCSGMGERFRRVKVRKLVG